MEIVEQRVGRVISGHLDAGVAVIVVVFVRAQKSWTV